MKHNIKSREGITMVALVITIVILIILATISIYVALGENGLIAKADKAKALQEQERQEEEARLGNYADYVGDYLNGYNGGSNKEDIIPPTIPEEPEELEIPTTWDKTKVKAINDGKGNPIPLPNGFYYVGGDIDIGLVISDKKGDEIKASGVEMGNQFVWIPVKSEADLTRTLFDTSGNPTNKINTDIYKEPYENGYASETEEYNTMKAQVLNYGGFYIGRFEAGVNSTTLRTGPTVAQTVVSKKGVAPYNYVPWGKAMNDAGEIEGKSSAVYLAKSMYQASTSVTSTLCYGCQWDAMCRYIGDSNRKKMGLELTGGSDISKNIYDLAGNCHEMTMEEYDGARVWRGGSWIEAGLPIYVRDIHNVTTTFAYLGFRVSFYIK